VPAYFIFIRAVFSFLWTFLKKSVDKSSFVCYIFIYRDVRLRNWVSAGPAHGRAGTRRLRRAGSLPLRGSVTSGLPFYLLVGIFGAFFLPVRIEDKACYYHNDYCQKNEKNHKFIHHFSPLSIKYPEKANIPNTIIANPNFNSEIFSGEINLPAINVPKIIWAKLKKNFAKISLRRLVSFINIIPLFLWFVNILKNIIQNTCEFFVNIFSGHGGLSLRGNSTCPLFDYYADTGVYLYGGRKNSLSALLLYWRSTDVYFYGGKHLLRLCYYSAGAQGFISTGRETTSVSPAFLPL